MSKSVIRNLSEIWVAETKSNDWWMLIAIVHYHPRQLSKFLMELSPPILLYRVYKKHYTVGKSSLKSDASEICENFE
jgi:hypothetical protein